MAYPPHGNGGPSFPMFFQQSQSQSAPHQSSSAAAGAGSRNFGSDNLFFGGQEDQFDIFEWYPHFQSCVRYFLDHAQHSTPVQTLAAFMNIQLPFQKPENPVLGSRPLGSPSSVPTSSRAAGKLPMPSQPSAPTALNPYIRRLVATGFDFPGVLHGFFGDNWRKGVGHIHEVERRNYLFAAKSANWLEVKSQYDMGDEQTIPFLRPPHNVTEMEIKSAESNWSEWLALQDWMLGPRSPNENLPGPVGARPEDFLS